ncbi:S1C family serine protease [Catellatospora sichuanensis]|uniref:S1C family serine protease n=1 Tax=Catellatospora sichuanensis TaxID=1969805 RepID=UPI0011834682|nr:trypsin-like peptidase domain-containing protein [Catellatospora sichuanensis]
MSEYDKPQNAAQPTEPVDTAAVPPRPEATAGTVPVTPAHAAPDDTVVTQPQAAAPAGLPVEPAPATWPQPQPQSPPPAAPQPPAAGHPGTAQPVYPQTGYPQQGYPQSGYPQQGSAYPGTPAGYPTSGYPAAGYPTGSYPTTGQPAWTPPGTPGKSVGGTIAKVALGSVAAVLLALGSGVAGAVIATNYAEDGKITVSSGSTAAAPVVDRSSLAGVAAAIQPSVVNISTGTGEGSGIILTEDGYILTNNHVVAGAEGRDVTVTLSSGKKVTAKVVGTDPRTDLGVVKANATGLKPAPFGNSDQVTVGDTALAIGSPLGLRGSVTAGIISARDRTISVGEGRSTSLSGLLQTDAPINPGNSGGALVNTKGEVIGINTAIATNGSSDGNIGVGFAIPSNKAKGIAEQIMNGKPVSHPYLGVSVTASDTGGAAVSAVTENSPANKAGLQKGDIISKFNGKIINDSDDLVSAVQSGTVGQQVTVEFTRNGEAKTATVTLGEAS